MVLLHCFYIVFDTLNRMRTIGIVWCSIYRWINSSFLKFNEKKDENQLACPHRKLSETKNVVLSNHSKRYLEIYLKSDFVFFRAYLKTLEIF